MCWSGGPCGVGVAMLDAGIDGGIPDAGPLPDVNVRLSCGAPAGGMSCAGNIVAMGSMQNSDLPADAKARCEAAGTPGTCCMFHLYGVGEWFLTDGAPQTGSRFCSMEGTQTNNCNFGAACVRQP